MTFEQEIQPIIDYLKQNGFTISEQFANFVELESDKSCFVFSKDPREQGSSICVGRKGAMTYMLRREIYDRIFNHEFNSNIPFPENFIRFLQDNGHSLVIGDSNILKKIEEVSHELAEKYTNELLLRERINELERLWQKKDFLAFVNLMEQTDEKTLPQSFQLRNKIAKKQVNT